jgi:hypothetical protein
MGWGRGTHKCAGCNLLAPAGRKYCHLCEARVRGAIRRGQTKLDEPHERKPRATPDERWLYRGLRMMESEI